MTDDRRHGHSREGVPQGDPLIEVTVRLYARPGGPDPAWPPEKGPFSGATVDWSYPDALHAKALDRIAVVRHAISVLLDDLDGSTHIEQQ